MRLLILTQYFPPETGAPQNRLFELAKELQKKGVCVEVLTAMPNYPKMEIYPGYEGKKYMEESLDGIKVYRSSIYVTKSKGISKRLRNYFSFVVSSYKYGKKLPDFDYLLCESPPLFLGYSATRLAKKLKAKLIFNVSDLWPESAEKLGIVQNKVLLKMAYRLEAKLYKKSYLVTGQTQGIVNDIKTRFPEKEVFWLPNGVDTSRYEPDKIQPFGLRAKYGIGEHELVFFYGGILGHAQGLEIILKVAERFKNAPVRFVLMGSGPEKEDLLSMKEKGNLINVLFADPVARTEMGQVLKEIDVSLIPLKKLDLFLGAIPSKIFEVLAMEKPIILGVDGEARQLFIEQGDCGWYFEPENVEALEKVIRKIIKNPLQLKEKGENGRAYVQSDFDRRNIVDNFYQYLLQKEIRA